jgi:chromate transporter
MVLSIAAFALTHRMGRESSGTAAFVRDRIWLAHYITLHFPPVPEWDYTVSPMASTDISYSSETLPGLLRVWTGIGLQSFGGGASTLYLIREACRKRGWLTEDEFTRAWGLVQISPGINIIKLVALIGYKQRAWPGLLASVSGLLLPSCLVTVLMTAGFAAIRDQPIVAAAVQGVIPATIGLSLAMGFQMAQTAFKAAAQEGGLSIAANVFLLIAALLLYVFAHAAPLLVLGLAGAGGMLLLGALPAALRRRTEGPPR